MEGLERLSAAEVANYPLECRERFLAVSAMCQTASQGRLRHFIYPEVDEILDGFLMWVEIFGDGNPLHSPD